MLALWPAPELMWIWGGLAGYAASAAAASRRWSPRSNDHMLVIVPLSLGVLLFAAAITHRWIRVGHGPFLTLFEVLLSNLFSLGLLYALAYWRIPQIRPGAIVALPLLLVFGIWSVTTSPDPVPLPATYDNYWLWVHVVTGKVFLAALLVAVGNACVLLFRGFARVAHEPGFDRESLDATAWRAVSVGFVFDTLMLIAGAAWARDAWGRFWSWDPLETWAFVTWLAIGVALHLRVTYRLPAWAGWWMIVGMFVLAVLTFLGVPFVSLTVHKGVM
jgi:ABC-type transport system involved in cytochrome c biogenesis permease subunit